MARGILDYPSVSAAIGGLTRYAAIHGGPHPLTSAIAHFHESDQDAIDDFILELVKRGQPLAGSFLRAMTVQICKGLDEPKAEEVTRLQAAELLDLAKRAQRGEDVWAELDNSRSPH